MHVLSNLIRLGVSYLFRLEVSNLFQLDVSNLFSRPVTPTNCKHESSLLSSFLSTTTLFKKAFLRKVMCNLIKQAAKMVIHITQSIVVVACSVSIVSLLFSVMSMFVV
jgi:hypothetical protein